MLLYTDSPKQSFTVEIKDLWEAYHEVLQLLADYTLVGMDEIIQHFLVLEEECDQVLYTALFELGEYLLDFWCVRYYATGRLVSLSVFFVEELPSNLFS